MAIFIGFGISGAVAQSGGAPEPTSAHIATVTDPAAADAVFDSGAAVLGGDLNMAAVPLAGTTDAGNGEIVEVRWVAFDDRTDVPTGTVGDWQEAGTAAGGAWSGTLTAPRNVYTSYRAEARVRGSAAPAARTTNRFFVGHVMAVWNQSNMARVFGSVTASQDLPAEPLVDPDNLILYTVERNRGELTPGTVVVKPVNQANADNGTVSPANVALSNTLAAARPGEKFAIAAHVASGTSPFDLLDDANLDRKWEDELILHNAITHNGLTKVGSAWKISWGAFDNTPSQVPAVLPFLTGKLEDGTVLAKGDTWVRAGGTTETLIHDWRDLYDFTHTRIGKISGVNDPATGIRWAAVHADEVNFPEFLDAPRLVYGAQYGRSDGSGGWTDGSHVDTVDGYSGAVKQAKMLMSEMLRMLGLISYPEPAFTNWDYNAAGGYIDVWNPNYDVTTWREAVGDGPSAFVAGFLLDTVKTTNAQLQPDAGGSGRVGVRITPDSGEVTFETFLQFAQENPFERIDDPADRYDRRFDDLPMMALPGGLIPAVPVTPFVAFENTLPQPMTFTRPDPAPNLVSPDAVGAGVTGITVQARVKTASGGSGVMVGQAGRGSWDIWQSGGMAISWKDSSNTNFIQTSRSDISDIAPAGIWSDLLLTLDLNARSGFPNGVARIWYSNAVNGTGFIETALNPNTGELDPGRTLIAMGMDGLEVAYFRIWLAATPTNDTAALGAPSKAFTADAAGNMVQTPLLPNW